MNFYFDTSMDSTHARKHTTLICAFTQVANTSIKKKLDILCNVKIFLGLTYILSLLECMQSLSKFVQARDFFICDLIDVVKTYERDIYKMYVLQLKVIAMEMGYFKLSLVLHITHMILYTWFGLFNLLLVQLT